MTIIFIAAGIIMLASLSGLLFLVAHFSTWLQTHNKFIIAFSSGIFAVVAYDLVLETFEFSTSLLYGILAILTGFLAVYLLEKMFPEIHHHEEGEDGKDVHCTHSKHKVIWGDMLHNIGDGILLVTAFAVDVRVGIVAAFGIFIHEFVQEMTEFSILKLSGMSTKKALTVNFLVSSTILIGVAIGLYVTQIDTALVLLFGISAGIFIHLVVADLLPQSFEHSKRDKKYITYIFLIVAGVFTLLAVHQVTGGHNHSHPEDSEHEHEESREHGHLEDDDHDH